MKTLCDKHVDCFANKGGECICLIDTDFNGRDCPFYKTENTYTPKVAKSNIRSGAFCFN